MKLTSMIVFIASTSMVLAQQQSLLPAQQVAQAAPIQRPERVQKQQRISNERMDYAGFMKAAGDVEKKRADRRITEERFIEMAAEPGTVVLDARSRNKYDLLHIKGAVSLPFTDFTEESLAKAIPNMRTRVLIYCNNNFRKSETAFPAKRAEAALNISTFIALQSYGYENVYELGPLLDVDAAKVEWSGTKSESRTTK